MKKPHFIGCSLYTKNVLGRELKSQCRWEDPSWLISGGENSGCDYKSRQQDRWDSYNSVEPVKISAQVNYSWGS